MTQHLPCQPPTSVSFLFDATGLGGRICDLVQSIGFAESSLFLIVILLAIIVGLRLRAGLRLRLMQMHQIADAPACAT